MKEPLPSPEKAGKLPPEGGEGFNRLVHEKSPYLLQHATNPVDWYPWGEEAFKRASEADKPLFISVGYSTCHWCHVMERESFEREEVARLLNESFVAVKVDREERPDIDDAFMQTTQLMTGRGGWPNSVWLTPDGRPWYAGTYMPREDRMGQPGFKTILKTLAEIWRKRRADVEAQADELAAATRQMMRPQIGEPKGALDRTLIEAAIGELERAFDEKNGGFDGAPKFPPHADIRFLLYEHDRRGDAALNMVTRTLDAMADGGIHDHVGGGFHRYSTDTRWFLPHFEKMLYDNALLARAYAEAYLSTGSEDYRGVAVETLEWTLRDMAGENGGFFSAMDAETDGQEGAYYAWTRPEILRALGDEEGAFFARVYGVRPEGNFRDEASGERKPTNVLYLPEPLQQVARREKSSVAYLRDRLAKDRAELLKARMKRPKPFVDDKVICAWNGLMIGSMAYCGSQLGEPRYVDTARKAADFILSNMRVNGGLLRIWRDGAARIDGFLDDYAFFADGLLELYDATEDNVYFNEVRTLADTMIGHYLDGAEGGFFSSADNREPVLARAKDAYDRALPSGNGVAARVLVRLAQATGRTRYLDIAKGTADAFLAVMQAASRATSSIVLAADMYLDEAARPAKAPGAMVQEALLGEPDSRLESEHIAVEAFAAKVRAAPGDVVNVALRLTVENGWRINAHRPLKDDAEPTWVRLKGDGAAYPLETLYPEGRRITTAPGAEPLSVYEGSVWVEAPVKVRSDAKPGVTPLEFQVHAQICGADMCLAPATFDVSLPLEVDMDAPRDEKRHERLFDELEMAMK